MGLLRWLFDPVHVYGTIYAARYGVAPRLVRGIVRAEGWRPGIGPTWEPSVGEHSYGPMQVLGSTAEDMGYRGHLARLEAPSVGMRYGVKYLARQLRRHADTCDAISAYNAGRPITGNRAYVCRAAPWCERCE